MTIFWARSNLKITENYRLNNDEQIEDSSRSIERVEPAEIFKCGDRGIFNIEQSSNPISTNKMDTTADQI